jgi:hypothetical protein
VLCDNLSFRRSSGVVLKPQIRDPQKHWTFEQSPAPNEVGVFGIEEDADLMADVEVGKEILVVGKRGRDADIRDLDTTPYKTRICAYGRTGKLGRDQERMDDAGSEVGRQENLRSTVIRMLMILCRLLSRRVQMVIELGPSWTDQTIIQQTCNLSENQALNIGDSTKSQSRSEV